MNIRTLRPGLLVAMSTSLKGNIKYSKLDLEETHLNADGEEVARWETTRTVFDPEEHDRAIKVRTKARGKILSVCAASDFGLLCPESRQDKLFEAIAEARALVDDFNRSATIERLNFLVLPARIAQDDVVAAQAITAEVNNLIDAMADGMTKLDVKAVRDQANKAKQISEMLAPEAEGRLMEIVKAARQIARQVVKAGETGAVEIDKANIENFDKARTAFLDLDMAILDVDTAQADARVVDFNFDVTDIQAVTGEVVLPELDDDEADNLALRQ